MKSRRRRSSDQLRRHDILIERLLRLGHALGQVEDEIALADLIRQVDQFADELFGIVASSFAIGE